MKKSIWIIIIAAIITACSKTSRKEPTQPQPDNFVILLDLSDRLLTPHQKEHDIAAIMSVFDKFESKVYKQLIINSKDKFCIRIIPQDKSPLDNDSLNNLLMIDMETIQVRNKKNNLIMFKKQLSATLNYIYRIAGKGKLPSDYQGVDIWRYFNENLQYDLKKHHNNHLIIITNGYFDLESYKYTKKIKNRFTSTNFFKNLDHNNWKDIAEKKNYGLIPVNKSFPETTITVIGIHPKNKRQNETDKLKYFWKKWLREMNFSSYDFIIKTNSEHLKQILKTKNI